MAIQIGGTTVIDNSRSLQNITGGAVLGIQSAGTQVGSGATTLNFIGAGNTFKYNPGTQTLDISISSGTGSTTGVVTSAFFSNPSIITQVYTLEESGRNYGAFGPLTLIGSGTITIGVGNSFSVV